MMRFVKPRVPSAALALAACLVLFVPLALTSCSTNPATGGSSFTAFMSPDEERRVGAQEHPKLVEAFGGSYDDPAIQRYVESLGRLLQRTSEQPEPPFKFVVLDSPIVNAFALPGGYVHISRGLMALANDEAELAGVVAHEIGHVTARHSAERYSRGVVAGIGAALLGVATGSKAVGNLAQMGAGAYVQGYSRSQELEADNLGVRYLSRGGFDATAMSSFLGSMGGEADLARKIAGKEGTDPASSLFSSHPRTADRVRAAAEAAQAGAGAGSRDRELYLERIDGMIYGDSPKQGFVRGQEFDHPVMRIRFTAPPGFRLQNGASAVVGEHKSGALLRFDADKLDNSSLSTSRYLTDVWAQGTRLDGVERVDVNGFDGATGTAHVNTNSGELDIRLVALRGSASQVYRFMFLTRPKDTGTFDVPFRRTTFSFRQLSESEANALQPLRLRVVRVRAGETVQSLADEMAFDDFRVERFRVLNGLGPNQGVQAGQLVKIVTE
jgi:predicted Zn-dependent protease